MPQKTVQPASPGSIKSTEPAAPAPRTLRAVRLNGGTANYGGGISATITSVKAINAVSPLPGQVGGPSVQVTVRVDNKSRHALALSDVVANAVDSRGTPSGLVTVKPASPLTGSIAPGGSKVGVYIFTIAKKYRDPITVTIIYSPNAPVARFVGEAK